MSHLIELKDIYKIYHMGEETVHALDGINLTVDQGEFVAIVGSSGSGKSTAMNIIGCLDVPTSGTYHLGGIDVSTMEDDQQAEIRNKMLGFIFQQYNLLHRFTSSVVTVWNTCGKQALRCACSFSNSLMFSLSSVTRP